MPDERSDAPSLDPSTQYLFEQSEELARRSKKVLREMDANSRELRRAFDLNDTIELHAGKVTRRGGEPFATPDRPLQERITELCDQIAENVALIQKFFARQSEPPAALVEQNRSLIARLDALEAEKKAQQDSTVDA